MRVPIHHLACPQQANILVFDQCLRGQWLHGRPGRCKHTDAVEADIRALRVRGARSVRYRFWNRTESRHAGSAPDDFDFRKLEADKTRMMLLEMLSWKPDASFYLKVRRNEKCAPLSVALLKDFLRFAMALAE